ncbi:hypothetical protein [Microseira wollei]|uniref:hypothetical protein n=1 Tax=Microseira wollei TaxID=467598 RepID=UPI001CFF09C1|nr:hypothetical protein [Microseira wollei]
MGCISGVGFGCDRFIWNAQKLTLINQRHSLSSLVPRLQPWNAILEALPPLPGNKGIICQNASVQLRNNDISAVDSYYQEIPRARRDGEQAKSLLFYCEKDLNIRRFFAIYGKVYLERNNLQQVFKHNMNRLISSI